MSQYDRMSYKDNNGLQKDYYHSPQATNMQRSWVGGAPNQLVAGTACRER